MRSTNLPTPWRVLALTACCSLPVHAQNVVVYDALGGAFLEHVGVSPIYPAMGPQLNAYPAVPPLPPPPPALVPPGGTTLDSTNGVTWFTDGFVIAATNHNAYALGPPPPPYPAPVLGGPITGMALDPIGGVLWLTDGFVIAGFPPGVAGAAPVFPPFPLGIPAGPLTGLEWDPITGTLWACDALGLCFNFFPGGGLAGPPIPAVAAPPPVTGICIDKTGLALVGPMRPLYVVGPGVIAEVFSGVIQPVPTPMPSGIAFHPAPSPTPYNVCPCPGMPLGQALRGPIVAGNPNAGVDLVGLPPGQFALYIFDNWFNPAFPMINGVGCGLGFNIGSPTLGTTLVFANAAGVASNPLNLTFVPPGAWIYMQIGTPCAADPLGVVLSPLYQLMVSAP